MIVKLSHLRKENNASRLPDFTTPVPRRPLTLPVPYTTTQQRTARASLCPCHTATQEPPATPPPLHPHHDLPHPPPHSLTHTQTLYFLPVYKQRSHSLRREATPTTTSNNLHCSLQQQPLHTQALHIGCHWWWSWSLPKCQSCCFQCRC